MRYDELKYEIFKLKRIFIDDMNNFLCILASYYIFSVIIAIGLYFIKYKSYGIRNIIIALVVIFLIFLIILVLFYIVSYIRYMTILSKIKSDFYGGTMIYLDKNIAVITHNVEAQVPVDKILDTIALDTAYKVHIIAYSSNGSINKDNENTLYDLLNLLSECNTYNRPIYVHISKYCTIDSKKFTSIADNITYLKEQKTHLYRFGNIVLKKCNKKYYKRIPLDSIK